MSHPIRIPEVQAAIEKWTETLLSQTGSAEIEVCLVFNVKERRFLGLRLGGSASRMEIQNGRMHESYFREGAGRV